MNSRALLERLVAFPTVSRDSNLDLIGFVQDFLDGHGVASQRHASADGRKANLYATIGPPDRGGVLLSGHTDVVPVDGQAWSSDPFTLAERDGRLYGRGAADMKGFLACALALAARAAHRPLRTPLHLALSYDEEVGCLGVRSLIEAMGSWAVKPSLCIVGEPTLLHAAVGHKGKTTLRASCCGQSAHSAFPAHGLNAIHLAADLIGSVRRRQARIEAQGARDAAYAVPYTTLHVGTIHGGTALNIIPERCDVELEIRNLAADDPLALVADLRADAAAIAHAARRPGVAADIAVAVTNSYPGLDTPVDAQVVRLAQDLTGVRECIKVAFGSEGGLFSGQLGIPTVVCGPGSIDQAHKPDEFIAAEQLARCDAMCAALLERLER
jgi:acetylornithine deacetylase